MNNPLLWTTFSCIALLLLLLIFYIVGKMSYIRKAKELQGKIDAIDAERKDLIAKVEERMSAEDELSIKTHEQLVKMNTEELQQQLQTQISGVQQDHDMAVVMGYLGVSPKHMKMYFDSVKLIRQGNAEIEFE